MSYIRKKNVITRQYTIRLFVEHLIILMGITLIYGYLYSLFPSDEFGFKDTLDPYYYSFTTLSTVGYGEITPKTTRAKLLTMTQQIFTLVDLRILLTL